MSEARDPFKYFRIEARELEERLSRTILAFEKEGLRRELIDQFMRDAHTLKGAARIVKLPQIAELAHSLEDVLGPHRSQVDGRLPSESLTRLFAHLDQISALLKTQVQVGSVSGVPVRDPRPPQTLASEETDTVRLDLQEVDSLIQTSSEAAAQLSRLTDMAGTLPIRELVMRLERVAREFHEIQDAAQRLRLLPVSSMSASLERGLRDAAVASGKEAALELKGTDVRMDSHVLIAVQGVLLHLVRNSVDHGIELPPERVKLGKAPEGRITVKVKHQGHRIQFSCEDDGRGIDTQKVKQKAVEQGLLSEAQARDAQDADILQLVFTSGLSTARVVTQLSGRGVGLDIVRSEISKVGGILTLESQLGRGTKFLIDVPVSMSSVYAIEISSEKRTYSIPVSVVRGALRVSRDDLIETANQRQVMYQGQAIPFAPLNQVVGAGDASRRLRTHYNAVVAEDPAQPGSFAALGFDHARGARELIVRPLPKLMPHTTEFSGISLDRSGQPQPLLNASGVVQAIRRGVKSPPLETQHASSSRALPVLVIDDSLTTRMLQQRILQGAGYDVDLAQSAEEGLMQATSRDYGIFLVDVEMPGMNGFDFISAIRKDPRLKEIPAVLITSLASDESRRRGMQVGAQGYVVKGEFDETRLISLIQSLTGRA